MLHNNTDSY